MPKDITYHSQGKAEENTPLVTILETNVEKKQSTAVDSRKSAYVIDLAKSAFGGVFYPMPGSQWYVKKIASVWTLMSRAAQQNPQLDPTLSPVPGDTYLGSEGTTYIVGDLNVTGSLVVGGVTEDPELGCIKIWTTNTAPTGWMICDGSAISRTTYADLFAIIGTTFGVGDGSTTFNIPNVKGKVPVGRDAAQTEFDVLGETGGAKTHALTSGETGAHTHAVGTLANAAESSHTHGISINTGGQSADHSHQIAADLDGGGGGSVYTVHIGGGGFSSLSDSSTGASADHSHNVSGISAAGSSHNHTISGSTASTGSGTAHNNLQPYIVLNYVIKVLPSSGGGGGGGASDLDDLIDVTLSSPSLNQVLKYNGSQWVNSTVPASVSSLDDLTDVVITAPSSSQYLRYNGASWVNDAIVQADVTNLVTDLAGKQPIDVDLTTISGLTATTDSFMQSKSSAWSSRTVAQVLADLAAPGTTFQPLDSDLTTIAGLTATTNNMIMSVSSAWASRTPTQVKAALAIAESDVTNLVTDLAAKQPLATLTTKGDIYVATGSGTVVRVGVGTNGQFLSADSAQSAGVTWAGVSGSSLLDAYIGEVRVWTTTTAPSADWMICDGSAISRTTYSALFALVGTAFGVGDGSTTFNIPNLKGRIPVGRDSGQTEFDTIGETGGAKTHTLVNTELPDHVHGWSGSSSAPNDTGDAPARGTGPGDPNFRMQQELYANETYGSAALTNGQPHNNLQPYMAMNYIIRVLNGVGNTVLDSLNDVTITSVADKNILQYNSGTSQWVNVASSAMGIPGEIKLWPARVAPSTWQICDGTSLTRATYPNTFAAIVPSLGTATMTIASPCVVTFNSHGFLAGDKIMFTTTGALPTNVSANTVYFVLAASLAANTFRIATTDGGTAINTTDSQSGTHTLYHVPWGIASSTTFNVPDFRGKVPVGRDTSQTEFDVLSDAGGAKTVTLSSAEMPAHTHTEDTATYRNTSSSDLLTYAGSGNIFMGVNNFNGAAVGVSGSTGSGGAHNNLQPYAVTNYIIKLG